MRDVTFAGGSCFGGDYITFRGRDFSNGCGLSVFDFGLHSGRHIDEVDDGYLRWIVNKLPESHSRWKPAASVLTSRKLSQQKSIKTKVADLLSDLKSCTTKRDLQKGRGLHANAVEAGLDSNIYVATTLINLYAKCGIMEDARTVFDSIQEPNVVSWNCLILGYVENGQGLVALNLFSRMKEKGICAPSSFTYVGALKACMLLAAEGGEVEKTEFLDRGRQIHSEIGGHINDFTQSTLINLYAKCGSMEDARTVFDSIEAPNVVAWSCLILGYADNGQGLEALDLFSRMKKEGRCAPEPLTYVAALKACTLLATNGGEAGKRECLERGRQIHSEIGHQMNQFMQSTLINLYANCCSMEDAKIVFDSVLEPDVVTWTNLILGYAENGQGLVALDLFSRMKTERRCAPNSFTYVATLKACTLLAANGGDAGKRECVEKGRQIHSEIGRNMDQFVQGALINLYAKCGSMEDARTVFNNMQEPSVVSWNCLILGYAENGQGLVALDLFSSMEERKCTLSSLTYVAALKACTLLAADGSEAGKRKSLERGRQIHSKIGSHMDHFLQSTLINLYAKCGSMEDAKTVFDSIQEPDIITWNALILGYVENGQGLVALDLFSRMKDEGRCAPSSLTYVAALKACFLTGALAIGRRIHSGITEFDSHLVTCLVDFYAKCGSMKEAREVFDSHPRARDVSTWTALLDGYAQFGNIVSVFSLFQAMQDQGFQPNYVTFVCVLSCCSHAGLVEKAWEYLEVMPTRYRVTPTVMHYNCMIDLLGRANKLDEAVTLLQKMPCDANVVTWTALLSACCKWKNVKIAKWAFKSLTDLDPKQARAYVLMAEIYGSTGMWEEQEKVLKLGKACAMDGRARNFWLGTHDISLEKYQEKRQLKPV